VGGEQDGRVLHDFGAVEIINHLRHVYDAPVQVAQLARQTISTVCSIEGESEPLQRLGRKQIIAESLGDLISKHVRPGAERGGRTAEVFQRDGRVKPLIEGLRERRKGSKQDGKGSGDSQHGSGRTA
jgi:hypothetical protein